jgi:hypothetical protein
VGRWAGGGSPDKHDRQPFFLPVLFSSHEVSIASFTWQQKSAALPHGYKHDQYYFFKI